LAAQHHFARVLTGVSSSNLAYLNQGCALEISSGSCFDTDASHHFKAPPRVADTILSAKPTHASFPALHKPRALCLRSYNAQGTKSRTGYFAHTRTPLCQQAPRRLPLHMLDPNPRCVSMRVVCVIALLESTRRFSWQVQALLHLSSIMTRGTYARTVSMSDPIHWCV